MTKDPNSSYYTDTLRCAACGRDIDAYRHTELCDTWASMRGVGITGNESIEQLGLRIVALEKKLRGA